MLAETAFTRFLNHHFAAVADRVLDAAGVAPHSGITPITDSFGMEILAFLILIVWFILVRFSLSVERPTAIQQIAEMFHGFVSEQSKSVIGEGSERYVLFATSVLLFILLGNLMGLVPGLLAPTSYETVTLGVALVAFFYYHYHGLRANGPLGYAKHFMGPIWWFFPLMMPIEIISHFARILSLSVRLYANMFAGDMVTLVFFSLIPVGVPLIFLALHLFVSLIQAYIFMILCIIYLQGAVSHDEVAA